MSINTVVHCHSLSLCSIFAAFGVHHHDVRVAVTSHTLKSSQSVIAISGVRTVNTLYC